MDNEGIGTQMSTTVYATAGEKEYVGGTIEGTGMDTATLSIGLGGDNAPPSVWATPDVDVTVTPTTRIIKYLVTSVTTTPGTYWCWAKISVSPAVEFVILQGAIVVI